MDITTIQLSQDTKKKISSFGTKGESYDEILQRIYALAVKTQLQELLMNTEETIPIDEAIREAEKEWPKST